MCSNKMSVVKGVTAGVLGGMILGFGVKCMMTDGKHGMKRKAKKVADAVESLTDTMKEIFG